MGFPCFHPPTLPATPRTVDASIRGHTFPPPHQIDAETQR